VQADVRPHGGAAREELPRASKVSESRENLDRAERALLLLEATGRHRGAIIDLRCADFDFENRRISLQPKKVKTIVPYRSSLLDTVRDFQKQ
jgi:integrase